MLVGVVGDGGEEAIPQLADGRWPFPPPPPTYAHELPSRKKKK